MIFQEFVLFLILAQFQLASCPYATLFFCPPKTSAIVFLNDGGWPSTGRVGSGNYPDLFFFVSHPGFVFARSFAKPTLPPQFSKLCPLYDYCLTCLTRRLRMAGLWSLFFPLSVGFRFDPEVEPLMVPPVSLHSKSDALPRFLLFNLGRFFTV